jgi:hypothetical protein
MGKIGVWFVVTAGFEKNKEAHDYLDDPQTPPVDAMVDMILEGLVKTLREPLRDFLLNTAESHMVHQPVLSIGDEEQGQAG